jgi:23S rRNA (uracil1939-C5)-methyltransferase
MMIPGGVPGDHIEIEVSEGGRWSKGDSMQLVRPSPDRVAHHCFHGDDICPASPLGIFGYDAQLQWKRKNVNETLLRIGGVSFEVTPVVRSPLEWGYRERIEMTLKPESRDWLLGYKQGDLIQDAAGCMLADPVIRVSSENLREGLKELRIPKNSIRRTICRLMLRVGSRNGVVGILTIPHDLQAMEEMFAEWLGSGDIDGWDIVTTSDQRTGAKSGDPLTWGVTTIPIKAGGCSVEAPATVFSQVNPGVGVLLSEAVAARILPGERLLDLYGGWGAFAISAALKGADATVIESDPDAIESGRRLARACGVGVEFIQGNLEQRSALKRLEGSFDTVVVDPPRRGLSREVVGWLEWKAPQRIIYVSCHPATLARDLKELVGYQTTKVQPFDMFPQTPDTETVVELKRR